LFITPSLALLASTFLGYKIWKEQETEESIE
jgi:hypothetical protein